MSQPLIQTSFAAGELSPSLWGHVDFTKYNIGAATMRNMFVSYRGGAYSRAGTAFVGYSRQTKGNIATGLVHFSGNPSEGDTLTLNGNTFTFTATPSGTFQVFIAGSLAATLVFLTFALPPDANNIPSLTVATYQITSGLDGLIINYKTQGTSGNSYTLAAASSVITLSGSTLTGGGDYPPRLITFQFNLNQGLVLEFGNFYMRVISQGSFVLEASKAITGAAQADPGVLTVVAHGYATGDWLFVTGVQGMTQLNGRTFVITVINANTFSLQDVFGNNIDTSGYGAYTGGGTVARVYTLVTPYAAADLQFLKFTQSADVMSLVLRNQITGTEYAPYDLSRLADDNWVLTQLSTASSIDAPTNMSGTATNTVTTGMNGITDYQYVTTAVDGATGEESIASNIADINNSVDISSTAGAIDLSWTGVPGAAYYNVYKAPTAYNSTVPIGALFAFVGTTYGTNFVDSNIIPDLSQVPPLAQNPFVPGQALSVTITDGGSSLLGPIGFTISTVHGTGATGFGSLTGGVMTAWTFTDSGQNYAPGDTITFFDAGGSTATGSIDFSGSGNPSPGDTITLGGSVWTFVASGATGNETNIAGSLAATLDFLVAIGSPNLNTTTDPNVSKCTYALNGGLDGIDITYKTAGVAGNAFTLAASAATPSGPMLTGGTGGTPPTGTLNVGPTSGTYPSAVTYFQERRVYANTANQPDTYFMSQPGAFRNFDSRVPTLDTDAITGTPWSVQVDGIQFMLPILGGLVVLTGQTAYQVLGTGGSPTSPQPVTPSSQQALPQAYNGCHFFVPPVKIDYDVYYLQSKGSIIRSLSYNFWINVFTGVDITYLSSQLFTGYQIGAMAWCEEPYKVMWCPRSDGVLLGLTSLKTQEVMAWTRHDTQGLFVSATSVTEPPVDALYVATQRFLPNGEAPFMIERMDNRIWNTVEECWCVDAALELPQSEPNATLAASSATGLGQPTGFQNLLGGSNYSAQVQVTIKDPTGTGCVVTPTVTSGSITSLSFSGGSGYTDPLLQFVDNINKGTGAAAQVILTNTMTFTTNAPVFDSGMVGWVIRVGGGVAQITAFTNANSVTAAITSPITATIPNSGGVPMTAQPGQWTLTETVTTITGIYHLAGLTVTGLADGNVIDPQVVGADGTVTLLNPASAVIIGLPFTAQLQSLYLEGGQGTAQGRRKKVGAVTARIESSGSFKSGTNQLDGSAQSPPRIETSWINLTENRIDSVGNAQRPFGSAAIANTTIVRAAPLFTGDLRSLPTSGFSKPGQVAVQQDRPLPLQVLAFIREVTEGDSPEGEPKQQPKGRQ